MAYKLNSSGIYQPLLTAINTVKSGSDTVLTISYFIDRKSFKDSSKAPSKLEAVIVDINNAFFQWEGFLSSLYSGNLHIKGNLTVNFLEASSADTADLNLKFSSLRTKTKFTGSSITYSTDVSWGTTTLPKKNNILAATLLNVGRVFGLAIQKGNTVLDGGYISTVFHSKHGLKHTPEGVIQEVVLHRYILLKGHIIKLYGNTNSTNPWVYGCTNSLSSNYNSSANVDDGTCVKVPTYRTLVDMDASMFRSMEHNYFLLGKTAPVSYYNLSTSGATKVGDSALTAEGVTDVVAASLLETGSLLLNYTLISETANSWGVKMVDRLGATMGEVLHSSATSEEGLAPSQFEGKADHVSVLTVEGGVRYYNSLFYTSGAYTVVKTNLEATPIDYAGIDCDNPEVEIGEIESSSYLDMVGTFVDGTFIGGFMDNEGDVEYAENAVGKSKAFHGRAVTYVSSTTHSEDGNHIGITKPSTKTIVLSPTQDSYTIYHDAPSLSGNILSSEVSRIPDYYGLDHILQNRLIQNGYTSHQDNTYKAYTLSFQGYDYYTTGSPTPFIKGSVTKYMHSRYSMNMMALVSPEDTDHVDVNILEAENGSSVDDNDGVFTYNTQEYTGVDYGSNEYTSHASSYFPFIISTRLRAGVSAAQTNLLASGRTDIGVGKKLVLIGAKYGFILTYIDNMSGVLMPSTEPEGLEVAMYATAPSINPALAFGASIIYGYLFKSAALSSHDNFLYAITEDPADNSQFIAVYNLTTLTKDAVKTAAVAIGNPLNTVLSEVRLENDGSIRIYSENSSEYIKITSPDLQASVDSLINLTAAHVHTLPEVLDIANKSNIIDLTKLDTASGELVSADISSLETFNVFNALEWSDPRMYRQLNIISPIPVGASLPIGDLESRIIVSDDDGNFTHSVDIHTLEGSSSVAILDRIAFRNNSITDANSRVVSAEGVDLAIVAKINNEALYSVLNRDGNVISTLVGELLSVESYTGVGDVHYKILTLDGNIFKSYKLTFSSGCAVYTAPYNLCMGTLVYEGEIVTVDASETIIDTCLLNIGVGNITEVYVASVTDSTVTVSSFVIANDITSSTLVVEQTVAWGIDPGMNYSNSILKVSNELFALSFVDSTGKVLLINRNNSSAYFRDIYTEIEGSSDLFITSMELLGDIAYYTLGVVGANDLTQGDYGRGLYKIMLTETYDLVDTLGGSGFDIGADDIDGYTPVNTTQASGTVSGIAKFPNGNIYIGHNVANSVSRLVNASSYDNVKAVFGIDTLSKGDGSFDPTFNFLDIKGELGGVITLTQEDASFVLPVFGCMASAACNYNPLATVSDQSCVFPVLTAADVLDSCGVCVGDSPVTHIDHCGTCQIDGELTEAVGMPPTQSYTEGTGTYSTGCYECPEGTPLGNGEIAEGCAGSPEAGCVEDSSVCTLYGCSDEIMTEGGSPTTCTGYGMPNSYVEGFLGLVEGDVGYPTTHLEASCFERTYGCACDGEGGLEIDDSLPEVTATNCTDCATNPDNFILNEYEYCDCADYRDHLAGNLSSNALTTLQVMHNVCDCVGTPSAFGDLCDCEGEFVGNGGFGVCNCDGDTAEDLHGLYCNCSGEYLLGSELPGRECYNEDGSLKCDEISMGYYQDFDGDGYANSSTLQYFCGSAPELDLTAPNGNPLWLNEYSTSFLGPDTCEGFSDECNECISYSADGVLLSTPQIMGDCGCYNPDEPATDYDCACADIAEGYCDCNSANPEDPDCGCDGTETAPSYTTTFAVGGIVNACDNTVVYDDCFQPVTIGEGVSYNGDGNVYTLNGEQYCTVLAGCLSYDSLIPLVYGQCCSGYEFDTSINECVLNGTAADHDCAGVQGGTSVLDACGVCDGFTTETPQCGCENLTTFVEGTITPGDICNCQGHTVDDCGVCNGSGDTCTGCTDPEAYNHNPLSTIDDGSCTYFGIENPDDFSVSDTSAAALNFGAPVCTHHTGEADGDSLIIAYDDINTTVNQTITYDLPLGEGEGNITLIKDNPYTTAKCQVLTRLSPTLTLAGADYNAETTFSYTISVPSEINLTGIQSSTGVLDSQTVSTVTGKAVSFYFRVADELENNTLISDVFSNVLGSNVISVNKLDVDTDIIEHNISNDDLGTPIYLQVTNPSGTTVAHSRVNYHVYRVLMALDVDGTIAEVLSGVDFTPYFTQLDPLNTTVYVCAETCEFDSSWETADNHVSTLQSLGSITPAQAVLLTNFSETVVVTTVEGTSISAPETVTYVPGYCGSCVDPCIASGGYLGVCTDSTALSYADFIGECEVEDNTVCVYPTPVAYCPDNNYVEFNPEATSDPDYWTPTPALCQTLVEIEDVEQVGDSAGEYTITIEPEDANVNVDYVLYTVAGTIIKTVTTGGIETIVNPPNCVGFIPIGFNHVEDWLDIKLTLKKGDDVLHVLDHGVSTTTDGSIVLKVGAGVCNIGCSDLTINTMSCRRGVKEDVGEFTSFTVDVLTEESPIVDYSSTVFAIYDLVTGEKLVDLTGELSDGGSISKTFMLPITTSLGVKVISENMVVYKIVDEYGDTIKTKSVYNSTYFEPFTLELLKPGCMSHGSYNYDPSVEYDDGSCVSTELYNCIKNMLLSVNILEGDVKHQYKSLKMYAVYQAYIESLKEHNLVKIEMYKDKLAELCNCKTC